MTETGQELVDDDSIGPTVQLWRRVPPRVPPRPDYTVFDHSLGRIRPSSLAFDDPEMSAYVAEELSGPEEILEGHDGFGIAAITAQDVRDLGLKIVRCPKPHPAHVCVYGINERKAGKRIAQKLAKLSTWIIEPRS